MSLWRTLFDDESADKDFDKYVSSRLSPVFAGLQQSVVGGFQPKFDVVRKDDKISILAELPGLSKQDVTISLEDDRLSVCGTVKQDKVYEDNAQIAHRERSFGQFCRSLSVPTGIQADQVTASMENGVLKIDLPLEAKRPPRSTQITIR